MAYPTDPLNETSDFVAGLVDAPTLLLKITKRFNALRAFVLPTLAVVSRSSSVALASGTNVLVNTGFTTITNVGDITLGPASGEFNINTPGYYEWWANVVWDTQTAGQVIAYPYIDGAAQTSLGDTRQYAGRSIPHQARGVFSEQLTAGTTVQLGLTSQDVASSATVLAFGLRKVA